MLRVIGRSVDPAALFSSIPTTEGLEVHKSDKCFLTQRVHGRKSLHFSLCTLQNLQGDLVFAFLALRNILSSSRLEHPDDIVAGFKAKAETDYFREQIRPATL